MNTDELKQTIRLVKLAREAIRGYDRVSAYNILGILLSDLDIYQAELKAKECTTWTNNTWKK